jgi:ABC-type glycerol-3-phosphate transport system substrate-binding protein
MKVEETISAQSMEHHGIELYIYIERLVRRFKAENPGVEHRITLIQHNHSLDVLTIVIEEK